MADDPKRHEPSGLIPTDAFDQTLERLAGLPGWTHVNPTTVQTSDFYGHVTGWIVQTVRTDEGEWVFLTTVNAHGSTRFVVPARVLATIDRQRETVSAKIRRRHGQRLAELHRGRAAFTPEQRAKGVETRRRKAALRMAKAKGKAAK